MPNEFSPEDESKWCRRFASGANNRAWTLSEKVSRAPEEDADMLHSAHAAAYLWGKIGTERTAALASLLLGQVHSLLGLAGAAGRYAALAREYFTGRDSVPWELALVHAVSANAARCSGDEVSHRAEYAAAQRMTHTLVDPEEKEIVLATLRVVPAP